MRRITATAFMTTIVLALVGFVPASGGIARAAAEAAKAGPASDVSAQQRTRRAPSRIRVFPSSPGPNAVRQCRFWLAQEFRPSGTVIVPRQRCWWEQG